MVNNTKLEKTSLREMAATTVPALLMVESTVGKNTAERALVSCHDSVTLYNLPFFTIHLFNSKRYMFRVPFDLSLLITFNWLIAIN